MRKQLALLLFCDHGRVGAMHWLLLPAAARRVAAVRRIGRCRAGVEALWRLQAWNQVNVIWAWSNGWQLTGLPNYLLPDGILK